MARAAKQETRDAVQAEHERMEEKIVQLQAEHAEQVQALREQVAAAEAAAHVKC